MNLDLHPDGLVYIRRPDGTPLYFADKAAFEADGGLPLTPLPPGMTRFTYESGPKILTYFDSFGNAFPLPGQTTCSFCEAVLAQKETLVAAKAARVEAARAEEAAASIPTPVSGGKLPATV